MKILKDNSVTPIDIGPYRTADPVPSKPKETTPMKIPIIVRVLFGAFCIWSAGYGGERLSATMPDGHASATSLGFALACIVMAIYSFIRAGETYGIEEAERATKKAKSESTRGY